MGEAEATLPAASRNVMRLAGWYALLGGVSSFLGWALDVRGLTDWNNSGISIQPNAAVCVMLAGLAVILLAAGRGELARIPAALVALIGGATLFEWVSQVDLGIDSRLMFGREWGRGGVVVPGRMGPPGSVSWTLLGVGLLAAAGGGRARRVAPILGLVTLAISFTSLTSYLYGASILYTLPWLTIIAFQTATFVLYVSLGLIASIPERQPMRALLDKGGAGMLARRATPILFGVPILLGWIRVNAQNAGMFDTAFGSTLRSVIEIALLLGLLWVALEMIRRHEAGQRRSAERITETLESISDGFVTIDSDWRFQYVNAEGERLLQRTRGELIRRTTWEVFPEIVDVAADGQLRRAMTERTCVQFEEFNPAMQRWFAIKAYPTADGGIAVYFEDVTARKRAQENEQSALGALRASQVQLETELGDARLLQQISVEWSREGDGKTLYGRMLDTAMGLMQSQFASVQALERGTRENEIGLRLLGHRGFSPEAAAHWERVGIESAGSCGAALRAGERIVVPDTRGCEFMQGTTDLAVFEQLGIRAMQSTPLISRGGRLVGMISTHWNTPHTPAERELRLLDILARQAADLIERSQSQEEREALLESERAARTEAEQMARLKDEFLATVSHELRTPLNAVLGWAQLLKRNGHDAKLMADGVDAIVSSGRMQAQIIDDLLDMNRIMTGKLRLDVQTVDLARVIEEALETTRPGAQAKDIRIQAVLNPAAGPIQGDPVRLQQVFWNLLGNAVKFTPKGGSVQVVLKRVASQVEVSVTDTGVGIKAEFLPHVFDRFRQDDSSSTRQHAGLGLGLAIAKQIVELHGGSISAASGGPGTGATFRVQLPVAIARGGPQAEPQAAADFAQPEVKFSGARILVVDDDPGACEVLELLLSSCDAEIDTANSGQEALERVAIACPDLLVCDIGMPGMDGFGVIRRLRDSGGTFPAIAVTAFARTEDRIRALQAGFNMHLSKPIDARELVAAVETLLRSAARI